MNLNFNTLILAVLVGLLVCWAAYVEPSSATAQEPASDQAKATVVCFGDSITKQGYGKHLTRWLDVKTVNAGVPGNSSAQALRRVEKDVLAHDPDVVVLLFGTNDLRADAEGVYVPVPQYKANLKKMIAQCRAKDARVVVCTIPPIEHNAFFTRHRREAFDAHGGLANMIESYRVAAREIAVAEETALVDLNGLLPQTPQWLSKDGVHPSDEGNAILAKHVAGAVKPLLAAAQAK